MHARKPRKRSDSGVVAVVVAIVAVLIFSLAAFAVDLGNAYARKRDIQTQADLATLAASVRLPVTTEADKDAVEAIVDQYAKQNLVLGQTAADAALWNFTDGLKENGYVEFIGAEKIRVITPEARVDFGLANAMGFSGTDVAGVAAAEIRSPGPGPMPFYASLGCNLGLQTISDEPSPPPPATPASEVPTEAVSESNDASIASLTPSQVDLGTSNLSISIEGTGFAEKAGPPVVKTVNVGFFRGPTVKLAPTNFAVASNSSITGVNVPADVLNTAGTWYVRVQRGQNSGAARWSQHPGAQFKVIDPNPAPPPTPGWTSCPAGADSGNFGTIILPRDDIDSMWVEANIALGVVPGLGFERYPGSPDVGDPQCYTTEPEPPTVISQNKHDIESETNCLQSDPGFPGAAVTAGYIAGFDERDPDVPGLLDVDSTEDPDDPLGTCAPDGISDRIPTTVKRFGNGGHVSINNDVLSCFITDSNVTVGQITQAGTLSAPVKHVLSPAIFDSPRFMWVPLFKTAAEQGTKYYKLIGFQPGFLTDQPPSATSLDRSVGADTVNGIKYHVSASGSTVIDSIKVIFFNPEAMPDSIASREPTWEYTGVGTKVPVLVE